MGYHIAWQYIPVSSWMFYRLIAQPILSVKSLFSGCNYTEYIVTITLKMDSATSPKHQYSTENSQELQAKDIILKIHSVTLRFLI